VLLVPCTLWAPQVPDEPGRYPRSPARLVDRGAVLSTGLLRNKPASETVGTLARHRSGVQTPTAARNWAELGADARSFASRAMVFVGAEAYDPL
jgi:hypothetical protein